MRYEYRLFVKEKEDMAIDHLYTLITKQARISTRRRRHMFSINLNECHLAVLFRHKRDADDFEDAFEKINANYLKNHGFI